MTFYGWYFILGKDGDLLMNREEKYKLQLLKKIQKILKQSQVKFKIEQEYYFFSGKKRNYVDFVVIVRSRIIPIEVKHDESEWTKKECRAQIARYNRHFKQNKKANRTILMSPKGRYGISETELLNQIEACA